MALCGNSLIVAAIICSSGLRTPTYFFLVNLSVLDVVCSCTMVPKLLEIPVAGKKSISYGGCMAQLFLLLSPVVGRCCSSRPWPVTVTGLCDGSRMSPGCVLPWRGCVRNQHTRSWSQQPPDATADLLQAQCGRPLL